MTVVTIGCAVLAVWLWLAPPDRVRRRLAPTSDAAPWWTRTWVRRCAWLLVALAVIVALGLLWGPSAAVVGFALLIGLGVALRLAALAARTRAEHATRAEVANACSVIANQVRVGRIPAEALAVAAEDASVLAVPSRVQHSGGDVVGALLQQAELPGCQGLRDLGRAWRVGTTTGAPMAELLDQVAKSLRADQSVERTVTAELAGPRATGKVMAVLPLCGIGLGYVLGGDPIDFLVSGPFGWACLVGGASLAAAGVLWIEALARQVGKPV